MDCGQIEEYLEAYALGALDAGEQGMVERHLATCAACRRRVDEWTAIAGTLPLALGAASPLQPPPILKDRVLAAIPAGADGDRPVAARPTRRAGRWRWWAAMAAAVVVLSLALAGVVVARERALRAEYADLVAQQEVVLEVVDSPRTARVLLRASTPGSTAYGKLYTRPDLPHVVVMAARLAPPPAGQAYHLWLVRDGRTELAGVLAVNHQGFGLLVFDADRPGPTYDGIMLTLQPAGSMIPTGPPILRG